MPHPRLSGPDVAILQRARAPVWRPAAHLKRHARGPVRHGSRQGASEIPFLDVVRLIASSATKVGQLPDPATSRGLEEGLPNMGALPSPSSYSKSPHVVFAMCISIWDPSSAARLQGDKGTEVAACRCTTSAARIPRQDSTAQGHVFGSTFLIVSDCVFSAKHAGEPRGEAPPRRAPISATSRGASRRACLI